MSPYREPARSELVRRRLNGHQVVCIAGLIFMLAMALIERFAK